MHEAVSLSLISLSFDDALDQHLDHALPVMEKHGLVGTFYTHLAAPAFGRRTDEWRDAARRGHELGNHTIFHPADARKPWVREGNAIDRYSVDRMRMELETANQLLRAIDGQTERTFAYPCSNPIVGRRGVAKSLLFKWGFEFTRLPGLVDRLHLDFGSTQTSYVPVVGDLFVAGRGGGLTPDSPVPPLETFNKACLPSVAVDGWTLDGLAGFVRRAIAAETWAILQFHGVGGGHRLDCNMAVFHDFIAWLADHCADRVVTVVDGARRVWKLERPTPVSSPRKDESYA
ncbi:MAG: polysaccharide deacetylase family protein [Thermoguttaceae bacterium]